MTTPDRSQVRLDLIDIANAIGSKLEIALRDPTARSISLSRDEAAVVIGLMAGAAAGLKRENRMVDDFLGNHDPSDGSGD